MKRTVTHRATALLALLAAAAVGPQAGHAAEQAKEAKGMQGPVKLMTLDPGHFHASLVQKVSYKGVDPTVHVYSPGGADLDEHMKRIELFNTRSEDPTAWKEVVYTGPDFFEKMIEQKPGNVVVISGNNAKKAKYILECVKAGFNVLSDKPMAITPEDFELIKQAFRIANEKGLTVIDIMTERYEVTTILQKELSRSKALFGQLDQGSPEEPAVTKESVHHYSKLVAGKPLTRPAWFFDTTQQGEGIVDVTTHLVDLIQWEAFPNKIVKPEDVKVLSARHWATKITPEQFKKVTGQNEFPEYLKKSVDADGNLNVFANGEFTYLLNGVHAKASVIWNFEAPEGTGDTHFSIMRGSKADLIIKQGQEQTFKPTLYVEKKSDDSDKAFEKALAKTLERVNKTWPGVESKKIADGQWEIVVPEKFKVGHEAHFGQVTEKYLRYLKTGKMPAWEVPNTIAKYATIMEAYKMSR